MDWITREQEFNSRRQQTSYSVLPCPEIPWTHAATNAVRIRASLSGIKGKRPEAENSPTSHTGVKKAWNFTSILANAFIPWYLITHRKNFASFTLMNVV
jgi:hypothetical protein